MLNEEVYQRSAFRAGADGFLGKRLKGEEIIKAITEILDGHKVFNEEITGKGLTRTRKKTSSLELPISQREREVFVLTVRI